MTKQAIRVMEDFAAAATSQEAEKIGACFTEDCIYEDVALGEIMQGREAVQAGYRDLFAVVPDFKVEITSLFSTGNQVGSEWVMSGTTSSGKYFSNRGASISELEAGRIKRNTDYYDPAAFLKATQ